VFDEPDVLLAAHHGWPEPGARRERLWTVVSSLDTCDVLTDLGVDIDIDGEDRPDIPASIRVVNRSAAARRYVMVQVKRCGKEAGWTLRVPASTPVRSLVVLYMCAGAVPDWPVLDPDELRDCEHDQPGPSGPLALEGIC
jgi:hypothetical protein